MSLKKADGLRWKTSKVSIVLNMLKQELANLEMKMAVLGNAQATIEQNMEELSTWSDFF